MFSIKVEPEAQAIIDKYRGKNYLLDVLDTYGNYKDFTHRMNENLRKIGTVERKGRGGKNTGIRYFPNSPPTGHGTRGQRWPQNSTYQMKQFPLAWDIQPGTR